MCPQADRKPACRMVPPAEAEADYYWRPTEPTVDEPVRPDPNSLNEKRCVHSRCKPDNLLHVQRVNRPSQAVAESPFNLQERDLQERDLIKRRCQCSSKITRN